MFYYLAQWLQQYESAFNVFSYHTVRAGGAAFTAFLLAVWWGKPLIVKLREFKIGQYIKEEHVAVLNDIHKSKQGTPTMGGLLMMLSVAGALLFWSTLTNRLLWVACIVFLSLGAVGFLDDYLKIKRKHNDGLSARGKFLGQILCGAFLGLYLVFFPITPSGGLLQARDVVDWDSVVHFLAGTYPEPSASCQKAQALLDLDIRVRAHEVLARKQAGGAPTVHPEERLLFLRALNELLKRPDFFQHVQCEEILQREAVQKTLQALAGGTSAETLYRLNRLCLETLLPNTFIRAMEEATTRVFIPGLKDVYIPLGFLYVFFVILMIVATSNAVNLTDGLDGLAAGVAIIAIMAYSAIAYVVSRADWSQYLYLVYVPEASELFVFGAALLGAGLGFLWYNAHPAEVFMGDTGSLALGGAISTMAILTKQELLLPIVGGVFVLEAGSVVLQVASFKLTGRRIFRMAPLHHHFELKGWKETKVVARFYILAILFALMSLATLKLR